MLPSPFGELGKRRPSRGVGAEPSRKTLRMPSEKSGLFVLHDRETATADIVAVHGLCGDPFGTWTEETSGKLWLRDFLPYQVPNTRIASYGYDSSVAFSKSEIGLVDVAADLLNRLNDERGTPEEKDRPVIFICHSLGGIVVKKALILAHERSDAYGSLLKMVKAAIFMGTPHRGADGAFWANSTARALEALGTATNRRILSDLQKNSGTLGQISQQFVERGSTLKMKTFYETIKLDHMNRLVVEKSSAILNLPTELPAAPIFADHRSMCKFASGDEQKYRPVWKAVEHFVNSLCTRETGSVSIEALLPVVETADPDQLLRHLPAVDQEDHKSSTHPSGCGQPRFYWIFRNIDFNHWQRANDSEVLWLSGPAKCRISDASSHIVDLAKERYPEAQHSVLYFFCSTAPRDNPIAITFVSTIVCQLVRCSPELKEEITTIFLRTLYNAVLEDERLSKPGLPRFYADDSAGVMVKKLLEAPSDAYWRALRAVTNNGWEKGLSLIIDGLDKIEDQNHKCDFIQKLLAFIEHLQETPFTTRVLLTSRPQAEIKEMLGQLPSIEYDRERKECLNSLRFDNTRYEKISEQHEGSLEWLWGHEKYLAWSSAGYSDLLLIEGKPGSGKSTLMKYFQRSLLEQESRRRKIVASFYYSYREGEMQTNHSNMLRSILYDILNQNEEFFFHLQPYYRQATQGGGHPKWSYKSLKGILLSLTKNHPVSERLYLIVDAMDESDDGERFDVIKSLRELCAAKGPCIAKVFVASRPVIGLSGHSEKNSKIIRLQDVNSSDISEFAKSFLLGPELDLPPGIAHPAVEYITENSQGVFVWVHLVREELLRYAREGCTKNEVFGLLKSLPTELEGIYKRILKKLERGTVRNVEVGRKILQFVQLAYRPLGLYELQQALAIPDDLGSGFSCSDESFEGELIQGIEKRIIACASDFLEIKALSDYGSGVVQVMHQTVREFFRSDGPTALSKFRMDSSDAHMRMSITCIRYLILCTAKATSIDRAAGGKPWTTEHFETYAQYLSGRPFFNYALEYVERHLQQCGQAAGDSDLPSQLLERLNDSPAANILGNWIPLAWDQQIPSHEQQDYDKNFRAVLLHAATRIGSPRVVEALLIAGAEVDAYLDGKTPLIVTAESGDLATARVLLKRGALVGNTDDKGQTALHAAAANGHNPVAGLLIDRGADKEVEDKRRQTPLHLAAAEGHVPVAGLLIDRGADKEVKDKKGWTPLHLAAAKGHDPIAELLIDRGADKEAKDEEGQTALHLAVASGHNSLIGLLVDRGANKEAKDVFGWGLLHTAAWNDNETTIQMLVESLNANKEERDKSGWTALHVAVMNGCDTASRCLIEHLGAHREAKDVVGWTALHFVAALGLEETAQLLIKTFGVDRGARNKEGKTAEGLAQEL